MDGQEEIQVRQRATTRRNRQEEEDVEEVRPEDVKGHTARGADNLSAVQKNIKEVAEALQESVDQNYYKLKRELARKYGGEGSVPEKLTKKLKQNPDTDAVQLLFNPKSFTQTVENVFHYSFLVKQGIAGLKVRPKEKDIGMGLKIPPGPVAKYIPGENTKTDKPYRQAIVSLNIQDWRDLVEAHEVKECGVPHRTGSKFERPSSASGSSSTPQRRRSEGGRRRRHHQEEE
jgi:hypothetical protein